MTKHFKKLLYLVVAIGMWPTLAGANDELFRAVDIDNVRGVQSLLQRGVDPNSVDAQGHPALFLALRASSLNVAAVLMAHPGLRVDQVNASDETPLMMAALRGHLAEVRRLIELGAAVDRPGWAPVHYAAAGPSTETLAYLLDRGASIEARSPNGNTPLLMAARYGPEPSVDLLLARGADRTAINDRNLDASDMARADGRESLAARLAAGMRAPGAAPPPAR